MSKIRSSAPAGPVSTRLMSLTGTRPNSVLPAEPAQPAAERNARQHVLARMTRVKVAPAPRHGMAKPTGEFHNAVFTNEAGSRAYKVYVPSGLRALAGAGAPLVVMLHGCTQDASDFALGTRMNEIADRQGFVVVYPEQDDDANGARCWNWFRPEHQRRDSGEPSLIAGITQTVIRHYPIDRQRVFVAGLSAGGAMAIILGTTYPDLYAAVGVHSGVGYGIARDSLSAYSVMKGGSGITNPMELWANLFGSARAGPDASLPTIVFHGSADEMVDHHNADLIVEHATAVLGRDLSLSKTLVQGREGASTYTQSVFADDADHPLVEQWVLHGQGHAWSGGDAAGSFTQPLGPDASSEMMRFFNGVQARDDAAPPLPRVLEAPAGGMIQ